MKERIDFGFLPEEFSTEEGSAIVIIPVEYDGTSTWIKGADKGPAAILEASANMELYDIETDCEVYQKGIFTDEPIAGEMTPREMVEAVNDAVGYHLDNGKFAVVIGGEHSVSIGAVAAHVEKYPNLSVLQLDAHTDLREEYEGSKFNHACVMARVKESSPIVQVGIRSSEAGEMESVDPERVFYAKDIYDNRDWIDKVVGLLGDDVYMTIDLDVFDPSIMPSTGTPEPGGLLWYDVLELFKRVVAQKNLVGFDVVELCPNKYNKAPDFLAAKLIYKLLSYKFGDSIGKS